MNAVAVYHNNYKSFFLAALGAVLIRWENRLVLAHHRPPKAEGVAQATDEMEGLA
jgi:hypothetical protein